MVCEFLKIFQLEGLTTIDVPKFEMGALGTRLIIDVINGKAGNDYFNTCLDVKVKIRSSTSIPCASPIYLPYSETMKGKLL